MELCERLNFVLFRTFILWLVSCNVQA
jgi:hypothetical protein